MCSDVSIPVVIVTAFSASLVSSLIIFIICGQFCSQRIRRSIQTTNDHPSTAVTSPGAPIYDAVLPTLIRVQELDVELKENVAYM